MSVLDTPRLYFRGKCTWDPIVTNNSSNYWDLETSKPDPPLTSAPAYRSAVNAQIASHGNWNPDGTHRSVFYETSVEAVDVGDGRTTVDELVNVPIDFSSMLVDINPYLANTSQLFYDSLKIGIDGGPQVTMVNNGPIAGRYINFGRNNSLEIAGHGSVIWQGSCVQGLAIAAQDSLVLQRFASAIANGDASGLTIRFNAYRTIYFNGPPEAGNSRYQALQARVLGGGFQPNPARSWVVGVVGLYHDGEPRAMPGDRQLSGSLGTAFARVDSAASQLVVDLANSVPETDFEGTKADLGNLVIAAGGTTLATLAPAEYNQTAYDNAAGQVSLDLSADQLAAAESGDLTIQNSTANPLLAETASGLRAVINPPNLYADGGEILPITIQVLRRGLPLTAKISVQVAEAQRNSDPTRQTPPPPPNPPLQHDTVETDETGKATIQFGTDASTPLRLFAGASQWVFTPFEGSEPAPPTQVRIASDCYLATRTMPADDDIAALPATWENVHANVLINWEALAPCMDNWLKLGSEQDCRAIAPLIKKLTSLENFNSFSYMPVTRGLSKGQRTLLHAWCDNPVAPSGGPLGLDAESQAEPPDFAADAVDMSRGFANGG